MLCKSHSVWGRQGLATSLFPKVLECSYLFHRTIEWFGLEGTISFIKSQPLCQGQGCHQIGCSKPHPILSSSTSRVQKISAEVLVADQATQCHRWDRGKCRLRSIQYLALREQRSCGKDVNPGYFTAVLHAVQKGTGKQSTNRMALN